MSLEKKGMQRGPAQRSAPSGKSRKVLRGCLYASLAVLALLLTAWLILRNNLGSLASGYVRSAAEESLNGRLEFSKLKIDLAGRAVMHDVEIIADGETEPVISTPRAVASLNFFTLLGPNRGQRTIVLTLHDAYARVIRYPDGGFNLNKLVRERELKEQMDLALAVNLRNARIEFTDQCLLAQGFPQIDPPQAGLAAKIFSELGYKPTAAEGLSHDEELIANGSVAYNSGREEVSLKVNVARSSTDGGKVMLRGSSLTDGSRYDLTIEMEEIELASLSPYAKQIFPGLTLHPSGAPFPAELRLPSLAAKVSRGRMRLKLDPKKKKAVEATEGETSGVEGQDIETDFSFSELRYASGYLPDTHFPRLRAEYSTLSDQAALDFQLFALGSELSGRPSFNIESEKMGGSLVLKSDKPAELAEYFGWDGGELSGKLSAELNLGGTLDEPEVAANARLGKFSSKDGSLESLSLSAKLTGSAEEPRLTGTLKVGKLSAHGLSLDSLSSDVKLSGSREKPVLLAGIKASNLKLEELKLGSFSGKLDYQNDVAKLTDFVFKGGEVPLKLAGQYNSSTKAGAFEASAGPLEVSEALKLAKRYAKDSDFSELQAKGKISLAASVKITDNKPTSTLSLTSERLVVAGNLVEALVVKGTASPPNIKIDSAEALITTTEPIDISGFSTTGPLKIKARLGGSVSQTPGSKAVLALTGEADTMNLEPEQAHISYKIIGPADDPEIRGQLKTDNAANPLLLRASGHYRKGMAPLEASLSWYSSEVSFSGKADLPGHQLDGTLKAEQVELARFAGDSRLSCAVSLEASITGSFEKPTIAGRISSPALSFKLPERTYRATDIKAGFKLAEGQVVAVNEGSFVFEGNSFTAAGVMGREGSDLNIDSANFNLFSVLALTQPASTGGKSGGAPLPEIRSSGPLAIRLVGTLKEPTATITYTSGPGVVEGHSFNSASLKATATRRSVKLESFSIAGSQGSASIKGEYNLETKAFSADANLSNFDLAVLAPISGVKGLDGASGLINGSIKASGSGREYSADGSLTLTNGKLQGISVQRASADLSTTGKGITVSNGQLTAQDTELTFGGQIGKDLSDSRFNAQAASMNLGVLNTFLPATAPRLGGVVSMNLDVAPSGGEYPDATLTLVDKGQGLRIGEFSFTAFDARAAISKDSLNISQFNLASGGSTLSLSGTVGIGALADGNRKGAVIDLSAQTQDFRFADITPFLPEAARGYVPRGRATANIDIGGSVASPTLAGNAAFLVTELPEIRPAGSSEKFFIVREFGGLAGSVNFSHTRSGAAFDFNNNIPEAYSQASTARITGSGELRVSPFSISSGGINLALSSGGRFTNVSIDSDVGSFNGLVGGQVVFSPDPGGRYLMAIGGTVHINQQGERSVYNIPQLQQRTSGARGAQKIVMRDLQIVAQSGTEVVYEPMSMSAMIDGTVVVNGVPDPEAPVDRLKLDGTVNVRSGEVRPLKILKYTVEFQQPTKLVFKPGTESAHTILPYLTGTATLTLPNVLSQGDIDSARNSGAGGFTPVGDEDDEFRPQLDTDISAGRPGNRQRDLLVKFNWVDFPLDARMRNPDQEASLTSEPPLPSERILAYLYGEISGLLSGDTEISDFAQQQAIGLGTTFLSRAIERGLGLSSFTLGGSGSIDNPYYIDVEKQIDPRLSLTYYRDFYSQTGQSEEIGVRYSILGPETGDRYTNLDLELNFIDDERVGTGSEFMFKWSKRF